MYKKTHEIGLALYGKIQKARKKYGIEDFHELLLEMKRRGDLQNVSAMPHKKLYSSYDYTLDELRLMPEADFEAAITDMDEQEMEEVFHYLGNTAEKGETIRNEQMKIKKKAMLKFKSMEPEDPNYSEEEEQFMERSEKVLGPRGERMLDFSKSLKHGMAEAVLTQARQRTKEDRKTAWLKARQEFIDTYGPITNESEFNEAVVSYEDHVENPED